METKAIVQYVIGGVVVAGSLFMTYNAQDKITDQAGEIKVLQNQVAALNDKAAQNEELINQNKALQTEVKNLETKLASEQKRLHQQRLLKLRLNLKPLNQKKHTRLPRKNNLVVVFIPIYKSLNTFFDGGVRFEVNPLI